MNNWEQIYECQDECEADQLRKQAQGMKPLSVDPSTVLSNSDPTYGNDDDLDFVVQSVAPANGNDFLFERDCVLLKQNLSLSRWLQPPTHSVITSLQSTASASVNIPRITNQWDSVWASQIKKQTEDIVCARNAKRNPLTQTIPASASQSQTDVVQNLQTLSNEATTESRPVFGPLSILDIQNRVLSSFQLNKKQREAFHVISTSIINQHVLKVAPVDNKALHMFLTGPGGTASGKYPLALGGHGYTLAAKVP